MRSCIYEGWVRHQRVAPVRNVFRYSLFMMYLDLAELDRVFRGRSLWSTHHFNLAYLRRRDHLGDPLIPMDRAVRDMVESRLGRRPQGPIRLLTHLRYFGYNFNPVSFYYCYDVKDHDVETIVAEIHNTPWGELFCYVLDEAQNMGTRAEKHFRFPKVFHISPFMGMGVEYDWYFTKPGEALKVQMTDREKGHEFFRVELSMEKQEITGVNLSRVLARYPAMTIKVITAIYWQALRLHLKGANLYTHPKNGEGRKEVEAKGSIVPVKTAPGMRILPRNIPGVTQQWMKKKLLHRLSKITRGRITLMDGSERYHFGEKGSPGALHADITVNDPSFYTDIALGGSVGAGESYIAGFWRTDDLTALIQIIIRNRHVLMDMEEGLGRISASIHRLLHALRKNTKKGSMRNIAAHYDLGNDFYALFLDETMTYSCNLFECEKTTLEEAAIAKYDRICRKLRLQPQDQVLDIGGGWGGFAIYAAKTYGCRVTTTTISRQQYDLAGECNEKAGLKDRITLLCQDYRDLTGTFDKLVSIEMIEAVGHHFLEAYFRCCSNRLKPDGMMALQAITMTDQLYDAHLHSADFIKRYIFPGSFIPSISAITNAVARATDMKLFHLEENTPHYARTLRTWRERFLNHIADVRRQGYPESFIRMWEYYFSYCEAGFLERYIGDVQMIFTKPDCRPTSILPSWPLP